MQGKRNFQGLKMQTSRQRKFPLIVSQLRSSIPANIDVSAFADKAMNLFLLLLKQVRDVNLLFLLKVDVEEGH